MNSIRDRIIQIHQLKLNFFIQYKHNKHINAHHLLFHYSLHHDSRRVNHE
uniref:Uncharacterized protein n=1 Tax=Anopheles christyi TaxID=43041 RepID=A0A182KII1_9DIPT